MPESNCRRSEKNVHSSRVDPSLLSSVHKMNDVRGARGKVVHMERGPDNRSREAAQNNVADRLAGRANVIVLVLGK